MEVREKAQRAYESGYYPDDLKVMRQVRSDYEAKYYVLQEDREATISAIEVTMLRGEEAGLQPLTSLYNIAWFNGRPCIWGDAALMLVQSHSQYNGHTETISADGDYATCVMHRGDNSFSRSFTRADAQRASLVDKDVWQKYPERMLQMRARAWAMRDAFADAFGGLSIAEEQRDVSISRMREEKDDPHTLKAVEEQGINAPDFSVLDPSATSITDLAATSPSYEIVYKDPTNKYCIVEKSSGDIAVSGISRRQYAKEFLDKGLDGLTVDEVGNLWNE